MFLWKWPVQLTFYSLGFFQWWTVKSIRYPMNVQLEHTWCNWRQMRKLNKSMQWHAVKITTEIEINVFMVLKVSEQQAAYIKTTLVFCQFFCRSNIRLTQTLCNYNTRLVAQALLFSLSQCVMEAWGCAGCTLLLKPPQLKNAASDKSCLDMSKGQN